MANEQTIGTYPVSPWAGSCSKISRPLFGPAWLLRPNRTSRQAVLPRSANRTLNLGFTAVLQLLLPAPLGTPRLPFGRDFWILRHSGRWLLHELGWLRLRMLTWIGHCHRLRRQRIAQRAVEAPVRHRGLKKGKHVSA